MLDDRNQAELYKTSTRQVVGPEVNENDDSDEQEEDGPISINGWEDDAGIVDMNPEGQQCFKQKYFTNSIEYQNNQKCETVEEESCGNVFITRYRASQV